MKKYLSILIAMLATIICFGCGSATTYTNGNADITSDWKLLEMTTSSGTTVIANDPLILQIYFANKNPSFKSYDGVTAVFSNNGKSHDATLNLLDDGRYQIDFSTGKYMYATIVGDEMTIVNETGTLKLVFQAK